MPWYTKNQKPSEQIKPRDVTFTWLRDDLILEIWFNTYFLNKFFMLSMLISWMILHYL